MRSSVQTVVRAWSRMPLPLRPSTMVIGYHRIGRSGGGLSVEPETFARQMAVLARSRESHQVVSLDDALSSLNAAPARRVVVTFDDAWADVHHNAVSVLAEHRIPAVMYVPSRLLGKPDYMTPADVVDMAAAGIAIGAHTRTHPDLRGLAETELDDELRGCREDLEDLVGRPVTSFAYPKGLFDSRTVAAVARAGYRSAVTVRRGWLDQRSDLLQIRRNFVEGFDDATFAAAINGGLNVLVPLDAVRHGRAPRRSA